MGDWWQWPNRVPYPRGSIKQQVLEYNIEPLSNSPDLSAFTTLRRNGVGLGYQESNGPVSRRSLNPASMDKLAHSSEHVMVLIFNGGFLDRRTRLDGLIDFIAGNFHIILLQESDSTVLPALLHQRAMAINRAPDGSGGNLAIAAGASGNKTLLPLYSDFDGNVPRPWTQKADAAMTMHSCSVAWVDGDGKAVQRAGLEAWNVSTVHYNNVHAKRKDSATTVLTSFFKLCCRDKVRLVGGDFNQAYHRLPEALNAATQGKNITYQIFQPPGSPEVVAILFNYPDVPALKAEMRNLINMQSTKADYGLQESDFDSHRPLILCISKEDAESRSSMHSRSDESKKRRRKHDRAKAALKRKDGRKKKRLAKLFSGTVKGGSASSDSDVDRIEPEPAEHGDEPSGDSAEPGTSAVQKKAKHART